MGSTQNQLTVKQEFLEDLLWDHCFFLIYINHLSDDLTSNPKLFSDDTTFFSIVQNINSTTTANLNCDLSKIRLGNKTPLGFPVENKF